MRRVVIVGPRIARALQSAPRAEVGALIPTRARSVGGLTPEEIDDVCAALRIAGGRSLRYARLVPKVERLEASVAELRARLERLADAAADLYCARLREGWERGVTEHVAAGAVAMLVADEGVDVGARLAEWRGEL